MSVSYLCRYLTYVGILPMSVSYLCRPLPLSVSVRVSVCVPVHMRAACRLPRAFNAKAALER